MRHNLSGRQLSRIAPHRHAMLRNMAASLLRHETIRTTIPKAKELRRVVEPLITLAKRNNTEAGRRQAFAQLRDMELVEKLFTDIGPHYQSRPGGYTRILHMMPRPGDNADMALMQLVDRPDRNAAPAEETDGEEKPAKKKAKTVKSEAADADAPKAKAKPKKAAKAESDDESDEPKKVAKKKAPAKKKSAK